uniref:putative F-box/FBD/LRR-repeat protein At4g03220 n=1 Tax=Erigeron canadensis TaxID=72917 RepID=UPI001CB8D62E|nr:putative F-box/FBD/LRR-repeat protein At4g03220 [Erigeron canadensis]XP_043639023.1 putative F-box/FBD/LRR-repeat protein At4g03220 [Erigeron canadensis]
MDFDHENVRLVVNEDRLSSLPDELIHHILSCIDDTKFVVQTCLLLSPRWQFLWKSLPRLSFYSGRFPTLPKFSKFVTNVLSRRNNHVEVSSVKLKYSGAASQAFVKKIANYAFSHNVQELIVISWPKNYYEYPLCLFSSTSLKHFTFSSELLDPDFTPKMPKTPWNFPALTTLHLSEITLCEDKREYFDLFSNCVNLKNLSLSSFRVQAKVFDIISPRLSSLLLSKKKCTTVINVIAPQLENLTIINCSINHLDAAPGLSSFVYSGEAPLKWFKGSFHFLNKVSVCFSFWRSNMLYREEDARETISMLQELQSVKFLTLNFDIVECLSAYPDLLSHLPSPFSNLICLTIDPNMRRDAYKVNMSTEARNFLLENSPSAMFIMDIPEEPPTKAMIAKQAREMKRAKLIADIERCMTELKTSLEQVNTVLVERKEAAEKTKVALENIIPEVKVWTKKTITKSEPEQPTESAESRKVLGGLMTKFLARVKKMEKLVMQYDDLSVDIRSKKEYVILLFEKLPKRQRAEMETRYARQLEEAEILSVHLHSTYEDAYNYLEEMLGDVTECISGCNSTCQDVSSSKLPLASQPSSSTSAIPRP